MFINNRKKETNYCERDELNRDAQAQACVIRFALNRTLREPGLFSSLRNYRGLGKDLHCLHFGNPTPSCPFKPTLGEATLDW